MAEGDMSRDLARADVEDLIPEDLGRFMGTILGSASIEMDQLIAERVGWWRFKQRVTVAKKAKKLLDAADMTPKEVPLRTSVPLLEAASLEEDEDLQDRWASLLANAAGGIVDVPPSFANVLRELDPVSAKILDFVYQGTMHSAIHFQHRVKIDTTGFDASMGVAEDRLPFHLDNMIRLGVLRTPNDASDDGLYDSIQLTAFGRSFVKACQPPGTPDPPILYADLEVFRQSVHERNQLAAAHAALREAEAVQTAQPTAQPPPSASD